MIKEIDNEEDHISHGERVAQRVLARARQAHKEMWSSIRKCRRIREKAILIARSHGMTVREIGRHLKLTGQRVNYLMKRSGIE
jgi:hypothetical protein